MPKRPHRHAPSKSHAINKIIFVVAFLQPLGAIPQILVIYGNHSAANISLSSWLIYITFDLVWLWYGITDKDWAVIISATMFTILESVVAIGCMLYGGAL